MLLRSVGFCGIAAVVVCSTMRADIIRETETITEFGTIIPIMRVKTATGQAQLNGPGTPAPAPVPPGGGRVEVQVPGVASAVASVNLQSQRKWHGWIALSGSGINGNGTSAGIVEQLVAGQPVVVPTRVRVIERTRIDPAEVIGAYFAPGVTGDLQYNLSLALTGGPTIFDSTTVFTEASGDIVTDNTGLLTWQRTPGFFTGLGEPGNLSGVPDALSQNRWVLTTSVLEFEHFVNLDPGETFDVTSVLLTSSSGSASGNGAFGIMDYTVPEPGSLVLFATGLAALALHRVARARRR